MLGDGRQLCVIGEFVVVENGQTVAQGLVDGQTVAFGQRRGDEAAGMLIEGVELYFAGVGDHGDGRRTRGEPLGGMRIARIDVSCNNELK